MLRMKIVQKRKDPHYLHTGLFAFPKAEICKLFTSKQVIHIFWRIARIISECQWAHSSQQAFDSLILGSVVVNSFEQNI